MTTLESCIYEMDDGKVWVKVYRKGRTKTKLLPKNTSLAVARDVKAQLVAELMNVEPEVVKKGQRIGFRDFIDIYIKDQQSLVDIEYRLVILRALASGNNGKSWDGFQNTPVHKIGGEDVRDMILALSNAGLEDSTIHSYCSILRSFYKAAIRKGYCTRNPMDTNVVKEELKRRVRDNERESYFKIEEINKLVEAAIEPDSPDPEWLKRLLSFFVITWCRKMEVFGLKWSEVSLEEGVISIPATRRKNKMALEIRITPPLRDILKTQKRLYPAGNYVFRRRDGRPLVNPLFDYRRDWSKALKRAGLDPASNMGVRRLQKTSLHSLRASGATYAIDHDMPYKLVMRLGGWKTQDMVIRYDKRPQNEADNARKELYSHLEKD